MIAYKLDMYGIVSYSMGQLLVYGLCWSYPCHHGNFYEHYFTLASHVEQSLTPQQSDYFSSISQQYEPLSVQNLPESVRFVMETPVNSCDIPHIVEWEVWKGMKTGKNIKSSVPGEHPARLRHEFGPELAGPASIIFNKIASTGQWLDHWKEG